MKIVRLIKSTFRELKITLAYLFPRNTRHKLVVEQYPDLISGRGSMDMFPKFKGHLQNDLRKCTGCADCLPVCPVKALSLDAATQRDGSILVNSYSVDLGRCYSCGACVDICAPNSLSFSKRYEFAAATSKELVVSFRKEEKIHPTEITRIRSYEVRR